MSAYQDLQWDVESIYRRLEQVRDEGFRQQYTRFGVNAPVALGVRTPQLNALAKQVGQSKDLARELWRSEVHEMKHMAIRVMPPSELTPALLWQWSADIYSWDLCDGCCLHLFRRASFAHQLSFELVVDPRLFVRRVGLVLMTALVIHNKELSEKEIDTYLAEAIKCSADDRPLILKAVSWLLRQIGKSTLARHQLVIPKAQVLLESESHTARWIGKDVLRELSQPKIKQRLK